MKDFTLLFKKPLTNHQKYQKNNYIDILNLN